VIDSRGCEPRRLCHGYQTFGLLCAERKVRAALVRTGNEDADGHYTLRDILVTLACVAGVPLRFRLAFVARSEAIVRVCRILRSELAPFGCELGVFPVERRAFDWLRGGELHGRTESGKRASATQAEAAIQ
jgi:hypothetical protein